ncbi:MAG: proline--tRNA ligase [Candidatus Cloacimonetes bacterium]|nr:proline--tRNA ligase [Candidatus Cloacimonadota bacterium]
MTKKFTQGDNDANKQSITKRSENYSQWFLDIISAADLADNSPVRGCMVIKPNGYAIWEKMQMTLDKMFKKTGVVNAYFPLFIPISFLSKEAEHVEGFATECAVVTHHRLEKNKNGKMVPAGELGEPLVVRPTSETIIYAMFAKWINSYRDLPILINQWANIVRWEMRTKPFLRTMEFLWQEGHTAHTTREEAHARALQMLEIYRIFAEEYMAIPIIKGTKSESEKFAGAVNTYTIEALMQDGKALQSGTSHLLGQNFAKAFGVKFLDQNGHEQYAWQTSWGMTTRMIGGLIMTHSDDKGLVLPPRIAPIQIVIIPIWASEKDHQEIIQTANSLAKQLQDLDITVKIDDRDMRPGPKFYEWEKKGIPVRIEIGPKDMEKQSILAVRRDTGEKQSATLIGAAEHIRDLLDKIQKDLLEKATKFRDKNIRTADSYEEFKNILEKGGFISAHLCLNPKCETKVKEETKATTRCTPFNQKEELGKCIICGKESKQRVLFARSY